MTGPTVAVDRTPDQEQALGLLIEELTGKLQAGEKIDLAAFVQDHPDYEKELQRLLPALAVLADMGRPGAALDDGPGCHADGDEEIIGTLGDFRILRELGRGGMGIVYEAVQISLGRRVALKVLPFANALDPRQLQRFKNEAQAAALLHHQSIVPVYAVGSERGMHYYAMQFIEGHTLAALIQELRQLAVSPLARQTSPSTAAAAVAEELASGRWAPAAAGARAPDHTTPHLPKPSRADDAVAPSLPSLSTERSSRSSGLFRTMANLGLQAAEALEHAHQLGVVHRDIKPANLLVDGRGNLWITDFGLAHCQSQAGLTMTGDLVGTLRYMSPEQALAQRVTVDHRTDIYSLGATLYELLTLKPAFAGKDRQELLRQIAFDEPRSLRRLERAIPIELETIVLKAMAKNPADRYATAQEMGDDLRRFLENKPIRARRPGLGKRLVLWTRRRPALAGLLVASSIAALALVGVIVGSFYNLALSKAKQRTEDALQEAQTARKTAERFRYSQHITLAQVAWDDSNMGRLEELLDTCPPDYRQSWEWNYLKRQCHANALTLTGHSGGVFGLAFSPDGKTLTTGSLDGTVRIWNATDGRALWTFPGRATEVVCVAFSPDGKRVAAANGVDRTVNVWDMATRKLIFSLTGHTSDAYGVAFSPDGKQIATGGWDRTVRLWDAAAGRELFILPGHTAEVFNVAFSPDGKRLASAGNDKTVRVWDLATRQEAFRPLNHEGCVQAVAFSPDAALLVSGGLDRMLRVWDARSGKALRTIQGHGDFVYCARFSPDGRRIISAGADRAIKIWDAATVPTGGANPLLLTLKGHGNLVNVAAFSPDGSRLASASQDRTVRLWNAATSQEALTLPGHSGEVYSVAASIDGTRIASAAADGMIKVWDIATGRLVFSREGHSGGAYGVAFSADGRWIATGGADQLVKVWDALTGQVIGTLPGHHSEVRCVAFNSDGKQIASGDAAGVLKIWDAATGEVLFQRQAHKGEVRSVAYDPDGSRLASAGADWAVRIWDATLSELLQPLEGHHCWCYGVAFSREEVGTADHRRRIASVSGDGGAKIWDAETGKEIYSITAHGGFVRGLAFNRDGTRLVTASADGTLRLWDVATGQEVLTLRGHGIGVSCVAFSPDGDRLVSGDVDGKVRIWDGRPLIEK
jgi:WD40 repeat protein/serine/threonine protein kinase